MTEPRPHRVFDVRPLRLQHTSPRDATDEIRLRLDQAVTGLMAHADQEHGEVDWTTLRVTIETHSHDGSCVLRSSAGLRLR